MKGYKVTMMYVTSIDVFVPSEKTICVDEIAAKAKHMVDTVRGSDVFNNEILSNLKEDPRQQYTIEREE